MSGKTLLSSSFTPDLTEGEKKAHVISFLKSKGITLDAEGVDAMIESAVYELTHGFIETVGVGRVKLLERQTEK